MRTKSVVSLMVAGALAVPALALADLGPHSSYYDADPSARGLKNDIAVTVVRPKHRAFVYVSNFCLGKTTYSGKAYPNTLTIPAATNARTAAVGVPIVKGEVSWHGRGSTYSQNGQQRFVTARMHLTVRPKQVFGSVTLPGKCGTIRFSAKLAGSTK